MLKQNILGPLLDSSEILEGFNPTDLFSYGSPFESKNWGYQIRMKSIPMPPFHRICNMSWNLILSFIWEVQSIFTLSLSTLSHQSFKIPLFNLCAPSKDTCVEFMCFEILWESTSHNISILRFSYSCVWKFCNPNKAKVFETIVFLEYIKNIDAKGTLILCLENLFWCNIS